MILILELFKGKYQFIYLIQWDENFSKITNL
jgi:hypothetical protein